MVCVLGKHHTELGICTSCMKVQVVRAVMLDYCSQVISSCTVYKD